MSVELFRDDDQGYAAWLAANVQGHVLSIQRLLNPSDARVGGLPDDHRNADPRQDLDRAMHQGLLAFAAGTGSLGADERAVRHHSMRHLPALSQTCGHLAGIITGKTMPPLRTEARYIAHFARDSRHPLAVIRSLGRPQAWAF